MVMFMVVRHSDRLLLFPNHLIPFLTNENAKMSTKQQNKPFQWSKTLETASYSFERSSAAVFSIFIDQLRDHNHMTEEKNLFHNSPIFHQVLCHRCWCPRLCVSCQVGGIFES